MATAKQFTKESVKDVATSMMRFYEKVKTNKDGFMTKFSRRGKPMHRAESTTHAGPPNMAGSTTSSLVIKMWNKLRKVSNPFQDMTRKERKAEIRRTLKRIKATYKNSGRHDYGFTKPTLRTAKTIFEDSRKEVWYANDLYQVNVDYEKWDEDKKDGLIHLSIKNHERTTYIPWQHKQWIKNDICGDEMEALEIFPAESRMVNTANQYHLWVVNEIPIGFPEGLRLVTEDQPGGEGSRGRQTLATREE